MAYKDGVHVADCLQEAAAFHRTVKIICRCGHEAYFDPHGLWWLFEKKGGTPNFRDMQRRYYCSHCYQRTRKRVRPVISAVDYRELTARLELPPESEWRRALQRFR